jgi:hypothetical protein
MMSFKDLEIELQNPQRPLKIKFILTKPNDVKLDPQMGL